MSQIEVHPLAVRSLGDIAASLPGATVIFLEAALVSHMLKEEQILFPFMLAGGGPMIVHPIAMMRHEHDAHDEELKVLAALTGDMKPPEDACEPWRALYAGLAKLAEDLTEHIHIENNTLFPRFEA